MHTGSKQSVYIIGAGLAGVTIAGEIRRKGIFGKVVAFLDDDPEKIGKNIDKIPVLGPIREILGLVKPGPEDVALIAIPSGTRQQIIRIYNILQRANFSRIRILPRISHIIEGNAHLILAREINPEDLLAREPVRVSLKESLNYMRGKRVLVTGAGGSIGSELARQLLYGGAERLYLFGHGENSIYGIEKELRILQEEGVGEQATIVPVIGELQDREFMEFIVKRLKADVVFHTAAHKHVPLLERNPVEAIKNNVFGTRNILNASVKAGVSRFVLISTDKAVEPVNVYGISKLMAEELALEYFEKNKNSGTNVIIVRFGNVLGSRGSILPLFKDQISKGGPLTVTHKDVTRYFMTIPEAVSLVLKAGGLNVHGEIFVLDMGDPVSIQKLAEHLIRFYGYTPGEEIAIQYTGLREGEKLTEELFSRQEVPEQTEYPKILRINKVHRLHYNLEKLLEELQPICFFDSSNPGLFRNRRELKRILKKAVPEFIIPENEPEY